MKRYPWLLIILCLALVALFTMTACAPPAPKWAAMYDAYQDRIVYNDTEMAKVFAWYGQPGVDWIAAHEEAHRTTAHLYREQGIDLQALMPGPTVAIRLEQVAQCEATAQLGPEPWVRPDYQVALGYWPCVDPYLSMIEEATP